MICQGIKNLICVERNIGKLYNAELFCAICPAENKVVPFVEIKKPIKCIWGKYTNEPFAGCKTCGGFIVECKNKKIWAKKRNSKTCNSSCIYFESS